jgi:hypothetical protein
MNSDISSKQLVRHRQNKFPELLTFLIGLAVGTYFVGISNVNPFNSEWLIQNSDLGAAHQIWVFFRNSPILQWPLAAVPEYGVGWNTVYTPMSFGALFGLPLKYLSFLLPSDFQFLGIYMVLLFGLQGFWGSKLIGLFVSQPKFRIIGGCSFLLFPVFLYRMTTMVHPSVAAHWMILAALYLYFSKQTANKYWLLLLVIALAENIYVFAIISLIAFASMIQPLLDKSRKFLTVINSNIKMGILLFIALVLFGYTAYSENAKGTGFFRLNAASFVFPRFSVGSESGEYSRVVSKMFSLSNRDFIAFEGEGFGYLGVFSLLLLPISVFTLKRSGLFTLMKRHIVLLTVGILAYIFALSNSMAIGRREFLFPSLAIFDEFRKVFRSTPRFSWLIYYLIALFIVVSSARLLVRFRFGWLVFALFIVLQVYDQVPAMRQSHRIVTSNNQVQNPLRDEYWLRMADTANAIRLVPSFDLISDTNSDLSKNWVTDSRWFLLIDYAAVNNLSMNFAYSGRPSTRYVESENASLKELFDSGMIEPGTLYFFDTLERLKAVLNVLPQSTRFIARDGFFVVHSG